MYDRSAGQEEYLHFKVSPWYALAARWDTGGAGMFIGGEEATLYFPTGWVVL